MKPAGYMFAKWVLWWIQCMEDVMHVLVPDQKQNKTKQKTNTKQQETKRQTWFVFGNKINIVKMNKRKIQSYIS